MAYFDEIMSDNPLVYLRLADFSGTNVDDSTANNRDFTRTDSADLVTPGALLSDQNGAAKLSGVSSMSRAAASWFDFAGTAPFTAEIWIRPITVEASAQRLINHQQTSPSVGGWQLYYTSGDGLVASRHASGSGQFCIGGSLTADEWALVALTYDGTNMNIYKNGVLVAGPVASSASMPTLASTPLVLGEHAEGGGFINGDIDEFALYDTALSATRLLAHYNTSLFSPPPPVVGIARERFYGKNPWFVFDYFNSFWGPKAPSGTLFQQSVSGGLSFAGALSRDGRKTFPGALGFAGVLSRHTSRSVAGALSFTGAFTKNTQKALGGGLTFAGVLAASHLFAAAVAGALSFAGALAKSTSRNLTGSLSFAGGLVKNTQRAFAGGLSFAGALFKRFPVNMSGAVSFAGTFAKASQKAFAGAVDFAGALQRVKVAVKDIAGALSFAGTLSRSTLKSLTGTLGFVGALVKTLSRTFAGALDFAGTFSKQTLKALVGTVGFGGVLSTVKSFTKAISGALSFSGAVTKTTIRSLAGTLGFTGAIIHTAGKALAGALSFSGNLARQAGKVLAGALSFAGTLSKMTPRAFAGAVSFAGSLSRTAQKAIAGFVSFAGTLSRNTGKALSAVVGFTGALTKHTSRSLAGVLSFVGDFVPSLQNKVKDMTASLSFSGVLVKNQYVSLSGALSLVGDLSRKTSKAFAGTLSFSGAVATAVGKGFSAALNFSGSILHAAEKNLTGVLNFTTTFVKKTSRTFTASLSFQGTLGAVLAFIQVSLAAIPNILNISHFNFRSIATRIWQDASEAIRGEPIPISNKKESNIAIIVKGPHEVAYKRGTSILFEATFTDKDGVLYDPDTGTAKMFVKNIANPAAPVYLTGYDRATGGKLMTKISVGVYQADWQSLLTDAVAPYEVEVEGFVGSKRSLDSVRVSVKS